MPMERILFCCATTPNLHKLQVLLPKVMPVVDSGILIVGRDDQPETIEYIKTFAPKLQYEIFPWQDSFGLSYNQFLKYGDLNTFLLILDDDEVPSDGMLKSLKPLVERSVNGTRYAQVEFRANPISEGQDLGPCNYYRQQLIKWSPQLQYKGHLHQYLVGHFNNKAIRCDEVYYHIKSLKDEYRAAFRNYWQGGLWIHGTVEDGVKGAEWYELRGLVTTHHPDVKTFGDLAKKIEDGTVNKEIVRWVVRTFYQFETHPHYNEPRAAKDYIFKYTQSGWDEKDYK